MNKTIAGLAVAAMCLLTIWSPQTRAQDTTPPIVSIDSPESNATAILHSLPAVIGTAFDDPGGSGIDRVNLLIQRLSDNLFWTSGGWRAVGVPVSTTRFGNDWASQGALPSGNNLANGEYLVTAQAFDKAGNSSSHSITISINASAPVVYFSRPAPNSAVNNLSAIAGTFVNAPDGTGPASITVELSRQSDFRDWTGAFWINASTNLATSISGNTWAYAGGLPTGANLPNGQYSLLAHAIEGAGAVNAYSYNYFNVTTNGPADG